MDRPLHIEYMELAADYHNHAQGLQARAQAAESDAAELRRELARVRERLESIMVSANALTYYPERDCECTICEVARLTSELAQNRKPYTAPTLTRHAITPQKVVLLGDFHIGGAMPLPGTVTP